MINKFVSHWFSERGLKCPPQQTDPSSLASLSVPSVSIGFHRLHRLQTLHVHLESETTSVPGRLVFLSLPVLQRNLEPRFVRAGRGRVSSRFPGPLGDAAQGSASEAPLTARLRVSKGVAEEQETAVRLADFLCRFCAEISG